ncbi:MAG: hypothetical protein ABI162_05040 [Luteolibacter sp.]
MKHLRNISAEWNRAIIIAGLALTAGHARCGTLVTSSSGSSIVAQETVGLWEFGRTNFTSRPLPAGFSTQASWKSLDAGNDYCLAVDGTGALFSWGNSSYGKLGIGNVSSGDQFPLRVGTDNDWKSVSAGGDFSTAIRTNGSLWAWGAGIPGEVVSTQSSVPLQVGTSLDWKSVATGGFHRLAIRNDGSLWAWGYNSHGSLGDGTNISRSAPVRVGTANDWASVACGMYASFAIKTDGSLWVWGEVFGTGSSNPSPSMVPIQLGTDTDWRSVYSSISRSFAFAIKQNGSLWSWGENLSGVLGLGDNTARYSPVEVGTALDWSSAAPGGSHAIATKNDGSIWMWGSLQGSDLPTSSIPVDRSSLFDPSPRIRVNETNSGIISFTFPPSILGEPNSYPFWINNDGLLPLSISAINLPSGFTLDPARLVVPPLTGMKYQLSLSAGTKGQHSGTAHILSNQANLPDFSVNISGRLLSPQDDTDSDGLNDAAELSMAALGFLWNSSQPALVETLNSNSKFAGLVLNKDIFEVELKAQAPIINPATQTALLKFELRNSADGAPILLQAGDLPGSPNSGIKLDFQVPENCGFVRVRGGLPK